MVGPRNVTLCLEWIFTNYFSEMCFIISLWNLLLGSFCVSKKDLCFLSGGSFWPFKGAKRINSRYRPSTYRNPSKDILERVGFPADNISSRVAWKFRGGIKVQKHVGRARVAMNAKQERIRRVYPLLMGNDNRFSESFFFIWACIIQLAWTTGSRGVSCE